MNRLVRLLFHEVADLPPAEREKVYGSRDISGDVRAEVESLLTFDADDSRFLTHCISGSAECALESQEPQQPLFCGPYRLIRLLGSGGMGAVYLAERSDGELQQQVAIKLLHAGTHRASWYERFRRERQLLSYLNHESVARLFDAGRTSDGRPYLVMEYVDGVPIDEYGVGRPWREKLSLFLRVCEGVTHAHRHLIIHRDLKPSNILVNKSGEPKLLDFGIAKLLDETAEPTQTVERLLTPRYASPEQLRGENQTTATDIYSLGAVLNALITGRAPQQSEAAAGQVALTRINTDLPKDVDYILRKALRSEPELRYASVEAFASDVRALLESRPVEARSGDAWYRTRKFLRRYWVPVAVAALVISSLAAGLYIANAQRIVAEQRFAQLRQLAKKIFDVDTAIKDLPGSIQARERLISASLEYLQGLAFNPAKDLDLAQEVAQTYWRIGQIQGVPTDLNLGQSAKADASLEKAEALLEVIRTKRPNNREVLHYAALVSEDRMILAQSDHRRQDALAQARKSTENADRFLRQPEIRPGELYEFAGLYANVALAYTNMHLYADAVHYAQRTVELSRKIPSGKIRVSAGLSILANALRYQGDLDGALHAIQEAHRIAETTEYRNPTQRMIDLYGVILREGLILGEDDGINVGRPADAIEDFQKAFDLTEEAARKDPHDSTSRSRVGTSARELGALLRQRDPRRALAVYDLGIQRLSEVSNNLKARRDRAVLLAGSSYALRELHRPGEAQQRITEALAILESTKDYPTQRVPLDSEAYVVLRALADHDTAQGENVRARETYEELLNKVIAAEPHPLDDLRDAPRLSALYAQLATSYRRTGAAEKADSMEALRLDLWRSWDRKLPNNAFVLRQLTARTKIALPIDYLGLAKP